jgi:hypothetical protein
MNEKTIFVFENRKKLIVLFINLLLLKPNED